MSKLSVAGSRALALVPSVTKKYGGYWKIHIPWNWNVTRPRLLQPGYVTFALCRLPPISMDTSLQSVRFITGKYSSTTPLMLRLKEAGLQQKIVFVQLIESLKEMSKIFGEILIEDLNLEVWILIKDMTNNIGKLEVDEMKWDWDTFKALGKVIVPAVVVVSKVGEASNGTPLEKVIVPLKLIIALMSRSEQFNPLLYYIRDICETQFEVCRTIFIDEPLDNHEPINMEGQQDILAEMDHGSSRASRALWEYGDALEEALEENKVASGIVASARNFVLSVLDKLSSG